MMHDELPRFVQLHRVTINNLCPQIGIFSRGLSQFCEIFLFLRLRLFQSGFHCGNILAECLCARVLRILAFLQKQYLSNMIVFVRYPIIYAQTQVKRSYWPRSEVRLLGQLHFLFRETIQ
jgi:hypothetical protein